MALGNVALKFLEALTERSTQVVFAFEIATNRFIFLNPAFEKLWQISPERVIGNPASLLETIHLQDQQHVQEVYQEFLDGVTSRQLEFRIIPAENQPEKWVCVTPFLLEAEQVIVGYAEDITAQKQYNDVLKKFSDKKNSVLNILSHDLAGPLGMIGNLASMLESDLKTHENKEVHRILQLIERTSRHGTKMLQEFLNQEFLESSQVELIKRRVNLVQKLKDCMLEYQQNQQMTGKTFFYRTTADTIFLELDDNKFMQVINNLISNAIKFTPDGGEITVALEENDEAVLVKVADTGVGIPEKHHDLLFEKFTPARRPGIKGEPSVGLGMSIIKTIVEWHHGKIWFESQVNKGTTFYIEVPKNQ